MINIVKELIMTQPNYEIINVGAAPNDGQGDPLRVAFDKINNNFANLMLLAPNGPEGSFQFANSGLYNGTANLVYDSANNKILVGSTILPTAATGTKPL